MTLGASPLKASPVLSNELTCWKILNFDTECSVMTQLWISARTISKGWVRQVQNMPDMMPATKLLMPSAFPSWQRVQYRPAKVPSLQQVVSPPLKNPDIPQYLQIFMVFLSRLPLHLSWPAYSYLVQRMERGLEATALAMRAVRELQKERIIESVTPATCWQNYSQCLSMEKQMELLKPVLSTLGVMPRQKAATLPSLQRYLLAMGMLRRKLEVKATSLGGIISTILMFQSGWRAAAAIEPEIKPYCPLFDIKYIVTSKSQIKFNQMPVGNITNNFPPKLEILLFRYTLWRYKDNGINRINDECYL